MPCKTPRETRRPDNGGARFREAFVSRDLKQASVSKKLTGFQRARYDWSFAILTWFLPPQISHRQHNIRINHKMYGGDLCER